MTLSTFRCLFRVDSKWESRSRHSNLACGRKSGKTQPCCSVSLFLVPFLSSLLSRLALNLLYVFQDDLDSPSLVLDYRYMPLWIIYLVLGIESGVLGIQGKPPAN